jgi:hypothetical protein
MTDDGLIENIWKKAVVVKERHYLGSCLERLRKPRETSVRIFDVPSGI